MNNKKIVILGGSFNPPTVAHGRLLLAAVNELNAEMGIFVPSSHEYVKNKISKSADPSFLLSEEVRHEMLCSMAAEDARLFVETVEYGKTVNAHGTKWRTVDTLDLLAEKYPDCELYFLAGGDKLSVLPNWDRIAIFLENYRITVVKRDGDDPETDISKNKFLSERRDRFYIMTAPDGMDGISSSAVRAGVSGEEPESVKSMCHPAVWQLLCETVGLTSGEICGFFEEYRFLSNFYEAPVTYRGLTYQNNEAAFQAQKCLTEEEMRRFTALSARSAKSLGRRVALRPDWEEVKVGIMEEIVRAKFTQNEDLAVKLINTGDRELIEGNTWRDLFWGVDLKTRKGKNNLGIILMKIRAELNAQVFT